MNETERQTETINTHRKWPPPDGFSGGGDQSTKSTPWQSSSSSLSSLTLFFFLLNQSEQSKWTEMLKAHTERTEHRAQETGQQ